MTVRSGWGRGRRSEVEPLAARNHTSSGWSGRLCRRRRQRRRLRRRRRQPRLRRLAMALGVGHVSGRDHESLGTFRRVDGVVMMLGILARNAEPQILFDFRFFRRNLSIIQRRKVVVHNGAVLLLMQCCETGGHFVRHVLVITRQALPGNRIVVALARFFPPETRPQGTEPSHHCFPNCLGLGQGVTVVAVTFTVAVVTFTVFVVTFPIGIVTFAVFVVTYTIVVVTIAVFVVTFTVTVVVFTGVVVIFTCVVVIFTVVVVIFTIVVVE